ncbi:MAG: DNA polymerase/3'-5' exonuclease PolX [Acidimicrobiia bacterium]|nr:DNA polymerase/3'-5' exonuclease PolX [Acidimicrobiia bacterium]
MVSTRDVVAALQELAALTTLEEESPQSFKVRAYENAISGIQGSGRDVTTMSKSELIALKGIGKSTADKILQLVESGSIDKLESLREAYPPEFVRLSKIPGIGPKTLKLMRRELGIENLEQLQAAIAAEKLRELPGLGKTSEEKIAKAIDRLGLHGKDQRTPISDAMPIAKRLVEALAELDGVSDVAYCGSLRRHSETIGDIDITVAGTEPQPVMDFIAGDQLAAEVIGHGETKTSILTREGLQIDVRVVAPEEFGAATMYFTGSKAHNIAMRQRAIDRSWLLNEYGLFDTETEEIVARETEAEIYQAPGMQFVPPTVRENTGEIERAAVGELPAFVTLADIRGDLHYHTDRSGDGMSSPEDMIAAAVAFGYEYIAVTDHGVDLSINGSTAEEMLEHRDRLRTIQEDRPEVRILFGCELNIGPDGSLDYDDDFRREFEWNVASVHSHFDLSAEEQTVRLIKAISDPTVNAIGHISGRYIGRRPGIEFDVDSVIEALRIADVGLEVNGALERLDAASDVIRQAVRAGVRLVISTDSHHVSELVRMEYGVRQAQRGWATARDVANTMPFDDFLDWSRARR